MASVELSYDLTGFDVHRMARRVAGRFGFCLALAVLVAATFGAASIARRYPDILGIALLPLVALLTFPLALWSISRWQERRHARSAMHRGRMALSMSRTGFDLRGGGMRMAGGWGSLDEVRRHGGDVLLLGGNGSVLGIPAEAGTGRLTTPRLSFAA